MFIYYYVHIEQPFEEVEGVVLRMLPSLPGWAEEAYRSGEHIQMKIGTLGGRVAKAVNLSIGQPARGATETWIPVEWEATGAPSLFPRMDADVVVAAVGGDMTQIALRGNYTVPLGRLGATLDRVMLHRVAEASAKAFIDCVAEAIVAGAPAAIGGAR